MKKIFTIIAFVAICLVGFAQTNTVVWANGDLIQDAVADSLFLYESEEADTIHLLIPRIVVREVHKTVYVHDTVYIESLENSDSVKTSGMENGYEWIDLGLSVKWATCNVGATKPEEFGDYFAWGEVETKAIYYWSTYKYGSNWDAMTKYSTDSYYGIVDNKTVLDPEDDAATANWGGNWRMPTKAEQDELKNNCAWEWITLNGVGGYKVIGPNGNSIFLPAAGRVVTSSFVSERYGHYWSSSLDTETNNATLASHIFFISSDVDSGNEFRTTGQSVRPVCK